MQGTMTKELLQALALANGVRLPEKRLEDVQKQYQDYLQSLELIESLPLEREAEPAIAFLPEGAAGASHGE